MSKRNRENRARKQKAKLRLARPRRPDERVALNPGFVGDSFEAKEARTRLAVSFAILKAAEGHPLTDDTVLTESSIIVHGERGKTFIDGDVAPAFLGEMERELGIPLEVVVDVLEDLESRGVITVMYPEGIRDEPPGAPLQ